MLSASGYPAERISVVRYPMDTIDLTRPISFLGLTAETYEANRAAVRTALPDVALNGVCDTTVLRAPEPIRLPWMASCGGARTAVPPTRRARGE